MPANPKSSFDLMPCHGTALRKAARRVTQMYEDALAQTGLRSTQLAILLELTHRAENPPTMAELAEALVIERSALGHTLRPLERDGLIRIVPTASDRRSKELHVTAAGDKRLQAAFKEWTQAQARFESAVGSGRASDLRALLRAVTATEFGARDDAVAR